MAATAFYNPVGSFHAYKSSSCSGLQNGAVTSSVRILYKALGIDTRLLRRGTCCPSGWKLGVAHASSSHSSVADPVKLPSSNNSNDSRKKSNEAALILIRHGESLWNEKNLFTGCVDVPLTQKGVEEALEAGKRISNIPVDVIYTSGLIRAQMTAMLAMTQHRRKKVPIIMHNDSEQAKTWSAVYSEETKKQSIPVIAAWQLNERMYGELQGFNKQETADKFGNEKVNEWRRSYDIPPPNGESLEMCADRAVSYFKEHVKAENFLGITLTQCPSNNMGLDVPRWAAVDCFFEEEFNLRSGSYSNLYTSGKIQLVQVKAENFLGITLTQCPSNNMGLDVPRWAAVDCFFEEEFNLRSGSYSNLYTSGKIQLVQVERKLVSGKNVMIAAHGNSLRSIIMYLERLTSQEVITLELSTGIPMLYIFKEGKFIRRGSPAGPSEAGVYAYTRSLALYRQELDDMLH